MSDRKILKSNYRQLQESLEQFNAIDNHSYLLWYKKIMLSTTGMNYEKLEINSTDNLWDLNFEADLIDQLWIKFISLLILPENYASIQYGVLVDKIFESATIVFSTVNSAGKWQMHRKYFDVCIVDEASQMVEVEVALLMHPSLKLLILAGDHCQLPATIFSNVSKRNKYNRSLFDRLIRDNSFPNVLLNTQYRMHQEIIQWPNLTFYHSKIRNASLIDSETYNKPWHKNYPPLQIIDTKMGSEDSDYLGSKFNNFEVVVIKQLVKNLQELTKSENSPISFGILSPYSAQIEKIKSDLSENNSMKKIKVSTIDGAQGQEFDIVIISAVRSNNKNKVGFLSDYRRLNVAITRARFSLIVLCSFDTVKHDPYWNAFVENCDNRGFVVNLTANQILKAVFTNWGRKGDMIKKVLDPMNDIFSKCRWRKVSFNDDFKRNLEKLSLNDRKEVMHKIINLANGNFPKREFKCNSILPKYARMLHIFKFMQLSIIWSIDVWRSMSAPACQSLKIWNIMINSVDADISKEVKKIQQIFSFYTTEYVERCSSVDTVPKFWPPDSYFKWLEPVTNMVVNAELELTADEAEMNFKPKIFQLSSEIARVLITTLKPHIHLPFEMSDREEEIVDYKGSLLILGRSGTGKTTVMLYRMLTQKLLSDQYIINTNENSSEIEPKQVVLRQLMVTASPILCEAIKDHYNHLIQTCSNNENPNSSTIYSNNAPLIITYRHFLEILNKSLSKPYDIELQTLIDYQLFQNHYYSRFCDSLKSQFDCETMFTEILSTIKGSLVSMNSVHGFLTLEQYVLLSRNRDSAISEDLRYFIYKEGFDKYQSIKSFYAQHYDRTDVVFHIFKELKRVGYRGELFSAVFVDEIAHGVGFRFESLKDIFFHEYLSDLVDETAKADLVPVLKQLTQNFRTHNHVLFLARSVIELIEKFFPNMIDKLDPESSLEHGPKPIFLDSNSDVIAELFTSNNAEAKIVEFGAEQVILVRDDEAKNRIKATIGNNALVLTVFECKGMEFDDCLIVDFFADSPCKNEWRVVLNEAGSTVATGKTKFDPRKHSILAVEFKLLYVLITRTKRRLVIGDRDAQSHKPMLELWKSRDLVDVQQFNDDIRGLFNNQSSTQDWKVKGLQFFDKKQFSNAKMCFLKANEPTWVQLCEANDQEQIGDKLLANDKSQAKKHFLSAVAIYQSLDDPNNSNSSMHIARCYEKAEEYLLAGQYYENSNLFHQAAVLYERGVEYIKAANNYWKANEIELALPCYYRSKLYREALLKLDGLMDSMQMDQNSKAEGSIVGKEIIIDTSNNASNCTLSLSEIQSHIYDCAKKGANYFCGDNNTENMMFFVLRFQSYSDKKMFLKIKKHLKCLIYLELQEQHFEEVAKIHLMKNEFKMASEYYLKAAEKFKTSNSQSNKFRSLSLSILCDDLYLQYMDCDYSLIVDKEKLVYLDGLVEPYGDLRSYSISNQLEISLIRLSANDTPYSRFNSIISLTRNKDVSFRVRFNTIRMMLHKIKLLISQEGSTHNKKAISNADLNHEKDINLCEQIVLCAKYFQEELFSIFVTLSQCGIAAKTPNKSNIDHIKNCLSLFGGNLMSENMVTGQTLLGINYTEASKTHFPSMFASSSNGSSHSIRLIDFCKHADAFFRKVFSGDIRIHVLNLLCSKLREMNVTKENPTLILLPRLNMTLSSRPPINFDTETALSLLKDLYTYYSMERHDNQGLAQVSSTVTNVRQLTSSTKIGSSIASNSPTPDPIPLSTIKLLINIIISSNSRSLLDMNYISDLRTISQSDKLFFSGIVSEYRDEKMRQAGLRMDEISKALLMSEIVGDVSWNAERLNKTWENEMKKRKNKYKSENFNIDNEIRLKDSRWLLINSFIMEYKRPVDKSLIVTVIKFGVDALRMECSLVLKRERDTSKDGIISMLAFVKLVEKYSVLCLMVYKSSRDVCLPESLAKDILCRKNPFYVTVVSEVWSKDDSSEVRSLLWEIYKILKRVIQNIGGEVLKSWAGNNVSVGKMLIRQIVTLVSTTIMNLNSNDKLRTEFALFLFDMSKDADFAREQPEYFIKSFCKSNAQTYNSFNRNLSECCKWLEDPLICINVDANRAIPKRFTGLGLERRGIKVTEDSCVLLTIPSETELVLPEDTTNDTLPVDDGREKQGEFAALTEKDIERLNSKRSEFSEEHFTNKWKNLMIKAKAKMLKLSPYDKFLRFKEKEFLEYVNYDEKKKSLEYVNNNNNNNYPTITGFYFWGIRHTKNDHSLAISTAYLKDYCPVFFKLQQYFSNCEQELNQLTEQQEKQREERKKAKSRSSMALLDEKLYDSIYQHQVYLQTIDDCFDQLKLENWLPIDDVDAIL
eukprot:gene6991-9554_t